MELMRKPLIAGILAFLLGAAVMAGVHRPALATVPVARPGLSKLLLLFGDTLTIVERRYVAPVDDKALIIGAIKGMVSSLDPHSAYLGPPDLSGSGDAGGVGLELTGDKGVVRIVTPIEDGPADRADLRSGDYIQAIDGRTVLGATLQEAIKDLQGPVGSTVILTVKRPRQPNAFDVKLIRQIVPSVTARGHMEGDYGYLRVSALEADTTNQAAAAIRALQTQTPRMKGLVLDIRDNPGGLLDQAVSLSSLFLDGGEVASQRGRNPADIEHYNARIGGDMLHGLPMAVLINSGTASGAEIVAGALQDRHRATLVGMTSFGAGTIQTVIPLHNYAEGAMKLTTSRIFTPSGRSFQGLGVTPDIAAAQSDADAKRADDPAFQFSEANQFNAIDPAQSRLRLAERPVFETPPAGFDPKGDFQLVRAIQALKPDSAAPASKSP
jgi:carboxyl-terminal processing protease